MRRWRNAGGANAQRYGLWIALAAANLPLIVVLVLHRESEQLWTMVMLYPGQFAWCLLAFPFAAHFALRAYEILKDLHRDESATLLRQAWHVLVPGPRLALLLLLFGLCCAGLSFAGDGPALYGLAPKSASKTTGSLNRALDLLRNTKESARDGVAEFFQYEVSKSHTKPLPVAVLPKAVLAHDQYVSTAQEVRGAMQTLSSANEVRSVIVAEAVELTAVGFVSLLLFIVSAVLARLRLMKTPKKKFDQRIRLAAVYAAASLALLSLWIPCRIFTVAWIRLFDRGYAALGAPYIIFASIACACVFVYLVFTKEGAMLEYLKGALPLVPVAASGIAMFADPLSWREWIGPGVPGPTLVFYILVGSILFAGTVTVLKAGIPAHKASASGRPER